MSDFLEVFDHPDKPGEYLNAQELEEYNLQKALERQTLDPESRTEVMDEDKDYDVDVAVAHPGSFVPGKTQSKWLDEYDALFSHPAGVFVPKKNLKQASELKAKGNQYYKQKFFDTAITYYSRALSYCPLEDDHTYSRAVFFSNRAASYLALADYERTIEDCTSAINCDPTYLKALLRRCKAYELNKNLEGAVEDINKVVELDGSRDRTFLLEQNRLSTALKAQQEALKKEMMDKLKGLGNSILGKFGMSLDNFKFNQQADGTYSMNFQQ